MSHPKPPPTASIPELESYKHELFLSEQELNKLTSAKKVMGWVLAIASAPPFVLLVPFAVFENPWVVSGAILSTVSWTIALYGARNDRRVKALMRIQRDYIETGHRIEIMKLKQKLGVDSENWADNEEEMDTDW